MENGPEQCALCGGPNREMTALSILRMMCNNGLFPFDDDYVFNAYGSFNNVQGDERG
jgi:hypothetical protein